MSKKQRRFIAVLYDPANKRLTGRAGKWMTVQEFAANPPQKPEDVVPDKDHSSTVENDPGGRWVCIDGQLHFCSGTTCFNTGLGC
jgi:hypothetical protein